MIIARTGLGAVALALIAAPAHAHLIGDTALAGAHAGVLHPWGGLDHVIAMVAVGIWAWHMGGRAVWLVPGTFVAFMGVGAFAGFAGVSVPAVDAGVALSLVVLGALVAFRARPRLALGMAVVGAFALYHGFAHAAAAPVAMALVPYALGFTAATVLLHAIGIGLGALVTRCRGDVATRLTRVGGGAVAAAGAVLLVL